MNFESWMGGSFAGGAKISGVGKCVPEHTLSNDDLSKIVDTSDEWIKQRTGIERRAILNNPKWSTSDLAAAACKEALHDAGMKAKKVQCLILATTTADYLIPGTAPAVAHMIGMETTSAAFDINAACSGFMDGLAIGNSFIRSGQYGEVMVVGADTLSRRVNYTDRATCILFGDAAGAVVMSKSNGPVMPMYFDLGSDGGKLGLLNIPAGGARKPLTEESLRNHEDKLHMRGNELSPIAVTAMSKSMKKVLERAGIPLSKVDHIIIHQMNLRMIEALIKSIGRKEKIDIEEAIIRIEEEGIVDVSSPRLRVPVNIHRIGNSSAASIPVLLAESEKAGLIHANQLLLLTAAGAGLTWGSCLLKWKEDSNEQTPIKVFDRARNRLGTLAHRVFFFNPFESEKVSTEGES